MGYPTEPETLLAKAEDRDAPRSEYANALLGAAPKIEAELGVDPSNLGSGFKSFADIAAVLLEHARVEWGTFEVEWPREGPIEVDFLNASRFTDATKMAVFIMKITSGKGRRVGQNYVIATSIRTSAGSPVGFDFYRHNMDSSSGTGLEGNTSTFYYLAIQDGFN